MPSVLQFAPGEEHLFVSSSSDNSLAIWDLRKLKDKNKFVSLASAVHPKTCQSAYFAPDGDPPPSPPACDDCSTPSKLKTIICSRKRHRTWLITYFFVIAGLKTLQGFYSQFTP
jgi:WD40 repeat protein